MIRKICLCIGLCVIALYSPGQAGQREMDRKLFLSDPDSALSVINRKLSSENAPSKDEMAYACLAKGILFTDNGMPVYARKYLEEAERLFLETGDGYGLSKTLLFRGLTTDSAEIGLAGLERALSFLPDSARSLKVDILRARAQILHSNNNPAAAGHALKEAWRIAGGDTVLMVRQSLELADHYLRLKDKKRARASLEYVENHFFRVQFHRELPALFLYLNARLSFLEGEYEKALLLAQQILQGADSGLHMQTYLLMESIAAERGRFSEAITYRLKKDSLQNIRAGNEQNILGLMETEYDGRLKEERISFLNDRVRRSFYIRVLLIAIIFLVVLFGISIYHVQKRRIGRIRKLRANEHNRAEVEQRLLESKLKREVLLKRDLSEEVVHTREELNEFSEDFTQYSEKVDVLRQKLVKLRRSVSDSERKSELSKLSFSLQQTLNGNPSRRTFIGNALKVDDELLYKLQSRFPNLTEQDIHLLVFIVLGIDSDELSSLYNIEKSSLMTKRYRLRKKLNMDKDQSFEEFLKGVVGYKP